MKRIGRYEVLGEVGRGGFGHVYRALDPRVGRHVAIKTLVSDGDEGVLSRFRLEATASGRLRHANIVTLHDFGEEDGTAYIVMELLEGRDLQRAIDSQTIDSKDSLSLLQIVGIMSQVGAGLQHAHAQGIIHRDIKPANIMLLKDGGIKIMDFGISLITQSTQSRLTPRGAMIGTFRYMAPEQFRGGVSDERSDLFAYGVVFYELLTGVHPFHASEAAAQMHNIITAQPDPLANLRPDCPPELQKVVDRLLQKDPDLRYQSMEDLLFDLGPIFSQLRTRRAERLLQEARSAKDAGRPEEANTLIREILELAPDLREVRQLRAEVQSSLRQQALQLRLEESIRIGKEALARNHPEEALKQFEAARELNPTWPGLDTMINRAGAAVVVQHQVASLVDRAEAAISANNFPEAVHFAKQAVEIAPDFADARKLLERAETLQAEDRRTRLASGHAEIRQLYAERRKEAALARARELAELFPESAEIRKAIQLLTGEIEEERRANFVLRNRVAAEQLCKQNKYDEALDALAAALQVYPDNFELQFERGRIIELKQQARNAALSAGFKNIDALCADGRFDDAIAALDELGDDTSIQAVKQRVNQAQIDASNAKRSLIERARALQDLDPNAAYQIIETAPKYISSDPEVAGLKKTIQARIDAGTCQEIVQQALALSRQGEFMSSLLLLEDGLQRFPGNAPLENARAEIATAKRDREREELLPRVTNLLDQNRFDDALAALAQFSYIHGPDAEVQRLREMVLARRAQPPEVYEPASAPEYALVLARNVVALPQIQLPALQGRRGLMALTFTGLCAVAAVTTIAVLSRNHEPVANVQTAAAVVPSAQVATAVESAQIFRVSGQPALITIDQDVASRKNVPAGQEGAGELPNGQHAIQIDTLTGRSASLVLVAESKAAARVTGLASRGIPVIVLSSLGAKGRLYATPQLGVEIDGKTLGAVDGNGVDLPAIEGNRHSLRITVGAGTVQKEIVLGKGREVIVLLNPDPNVGDVLIKTNPSGVRIELTNAAGKKWAATAQAGFARFAGLLPGTYTLQASRDGFLQAQDQVEVRAAEGITREVMLAGAPTTASVSIRAKPGATLVYAGRSVEIPADGEFAIKDIPPGLTLFEIRVPGYKPATKSVDLRAGDNPAFELVPSERLVGTLRLKRNPSNSEVAYQRDGEQAYTAIPADQIELPEGLYHLRVRALGYPGLSTDVRVKTGETVEAPDLTLKKDAAPAPTAPTPAPVSSFELFSDNEWTKAPDGSRIHKTDISRVAVPPGVFLFTMEPRSPSGIRSRFSKGTKLQWQVGDFHFLIEDGLRYSSSEQTDGKRIEHEKEKPIAKQDRYQIELSVGRTNLTVKILEGGQWRVLETLNAVNPDRLKGYFAFYSDVQVDSFAKR